MTNRAFIPLAAGVAAMLCAVAAPASVAAAEIFTDEGDFLAALGGGTSVVNFDGAAVGPIVGNEFAGSGFVFAALGPTPGGTPPLEIAPSDFFHPSSYLNPGKRPFGAGPSDGSDAIEIQVQGGWNAIGFSIVDGQLGLPSGEPIEVYNVGDQLLFSGPTGSTGYFGFIANEPIGRVVTNENTDDGDDLGYDDFILGNVQSVPSLPSGALLLLAASLAVLGWKMSHRTLAPR